MGMDSAPAHGWTISDEDLQKLVPKEYDALIHVLEQVHEMCLGDLARDFQMEAGVDKEISHAYADLVEAFEKATLVDDVSLTLDLGYYDEESGGLYDELETSHYWCVGNMTCYTAPGERFSNIITEKSWTQYG